MKDERETQISTVGGSDTAGEKLKSQSGRNNNRDGNYAYYVNLFYFDSAKMDDYDKDQTLSVRCLKD